MSPPLRILISGSGIASSVFANCLLRAHSNAAITIIERASRPRLTGASVDIRNSAVDIIQKMGLKATIRNHTTNEAGIEWVSSNGASIAKLAASGRADVQSVTSEYEIFRGALAQIFIEPLLPRVELVFDESVESYEQDGEGIAVTFAKSGEVRRYDLLVAAEGMGSEIRGQMLGAPPREQIKDEGVHVAYFTHKKDLLNGEKFAQGFNATRGRTIYVRPDPDPAGRSRVMLLNVTWKSNVEAKKRLNDALAAGNEAYMKMLEEEFSDVGWLAPEVLRGMRESDDFYCSLFAQVRSPRLCDGRVVLLGDAGYATPGIGTSLAIMGGYVLAGELSRSGGDVATSLKRYEDLILPFVKTQQGDDFAMQLANPQTATGIAVMRLAVRVFTGLRLDKLVMSVMGWMGGEKKMAMPEYVWPNGLIWETQDRNGTD